MPLGAANQLISWVQMHSRMINEKLHVLITALGHVLTDKVIA
jgi:hypothetical protein